MSPPAAGQSPPHEEDRALSGAILPDGVKVWDDPFHRLHLVIGDKEYAAVRAVRIFPVSSKNDCVSFLDEQGKEVALLAHPRKLDKASRNALERALERMYYVPKITRIDRITETGGITHWEVMTDRGYANFELTDREHIRKLPGRRLMMHDPDGNRFEVEDLAKLDKRSLDMLQSEL